MVVPEKIPSQDSSTPKERTRARFMILRTLISMLLLGICFIAIANKFLLFPVFGLEFLKLEWWQIGLGILISITLMIGWEPEDDDIFKMGRGGPPIIR